MKATITIVGNLGRNPEHKAFRSGNEIAEFSVGVNYLGRGGEKMTDWYDVTVWGERQRETALTHLRKGSAVTVVGEFNTRPWMSNSGDKGVALEISATQLHPHRYRDDLEQEHGKGIEKQDDSQTQVTDDDIPF